MTLASGLRYRCVEPGMRFELGYDDGGELAVDLTFEALVPPHYLGGAHLDQPGRVRGTLDLRGERITVDCLAMRDRTWSRRSDLDVNVGGGSHRGGYSYTAVSSSEAFQAITALMGDGGDYRVLGGLLLRDGEVSDLVGGSRRVVERDGERGHQRQVTPALEDAMGRTLEAGGVCYNAFAWRFTPGMFSWNCLTEWSWHAGTAGVRTTTTGAPPPGGRSACAGGTCREHRQPARRRLPGASRPALAAKHRACGW